MAIKTFTTGEVLTASDTNTYLANAGLVYVTSVTPGTNVTSVQINNCFTSTYDNYFVTITNVDCNTNGDVWYAQLSTSGTPSAANYQGNTFYVTSGNTGGLTNASIGSYFEVCSASNTSTASGGFNLFQPALAQWTRCMFGPTVDDFYFRFGGGVHKVTTSYDGMKIGTVTGSFTGGTITVYGYRKA